jgi:uncharacterized protein
MNKEEAKLIEETATFVRNELAGAESGHDWWHIFRVWKLADSLARHEKADRLVVNLGALLHDIADAKFYDGDESVGPRKAKKFLASLKIPENTIAQVLNIIRFVSFKNRQETPEDDSIELHIVQDADRLDALGAIGIARTFSYGGYKKREMYNPDIPPRPGMTKEEYKKSEGPTLNHFYEKLLLLKDMMHTRTARRMAENRHCFMEKFLAEFYAEWNGTK